MSDKVVVLLGLVLNLFCSNLEAVGLPDIIDQIRGSVVGIGTTVPARPGASGKPVVTFVGTGFVVGNGRQVITNYHVISKQLDKNRKETLAIFVGQGRVAKVRVAKVQRADPAHDLALLTIEGQALPAMKLGDGKSIREGRAVAFTGFPIGVILGLYPVTHQGIVSTITPVVTPAMSSRVLTARQIKAMRRGFDVYQLDAIAYPGNSGSAVYEIDSGAVIGVLNSVFVKETKEAVLQKPSGIAYAIPVEHVLNLLNNK